MLGSRPRRAKADEEAEPFLPDAPDSHAGTSSSSANRAATSILPRRCCRAWGVLPRRRQLPRCLLFSLGWVSCALLFVSLVAGVLFPSYANPPAHYNELRSLVETSKQPGRANPNNEKIFIAASIYDAGGKLLSGTWGNAVLSLVDLLGPDNVHVSLYENDPDQAARQAAEDFRNKLACNATVTIEELEKEKLPHVTFNSGARQMKRIAMLAEVRNRALDPLYDLPQAFDRLLYVNDVIFDPIDAAQLLLSTNRGTNGKANYLAACAIDFINPFKFYDTYASRDLEGYSMGVPFYPWFSSAGHARSRRDVLAESDAVRVKSCWGGMVAFDAQYFQGRKTDSNGKPQNKTVVRFRSSDETYWEASECCLIHADLAVAANRVSLDRDAGIYVNPYIRTAYDESTYGWLPYVRRPEYLFAYAQAFVNWIAGLPFSNPRRKHRPGQHVNQWVWDDMATPTQSVTTLAQGAWSNITRIAKPGGFCGLRQLAVMTNRPSGPRWTLLDVPSLPAGASEK